MNNAISCFRDVMCAAGLEPPDFIEPGKLHRFPGVGKNKGNTAGWCKLFEDGMGGCYGDWSSGLSVHWRAKRNEPYFCTDRVDFARRVRATKIQAAFEQRIRQADAANWAAVIWNEAAPAGINHPYLIRKRIQPHSARLHDGALVLPITDSANRLTSLQFIAPDGTKRLLAGGRKRSCFIYVGGAMEKPARIILCEGWATGCTLAENESTVLVLAAIDAGNLQPVALATRQRWPFAELVIAGDDDRSTVGNPGATKAKAAAIASGALLALPQWPESAPKHLTDFNDLAVWLAHQIKQGGDK